MQDNPVLNAIRERRSIRKYSSKPVPKELIDQLLSAAALSPSSMNRQPWRFIVITDRKKIRELSDAVKRLTPMDGLATHLIERMRSSEDLLFYDAPLLILVYADRKLTKWIDIDCGILSQTMFLAAHSLGLGSCYIGLAQVLNNDGELLRGLGVPDGSQIIAPLIFGYPAEEKGVPERAPKVVKWI